MFCTTFYSFKGGVGRTMALVNTACELAKRGKKVLIVDFDLEAPGITSFDIFRDAKNKKGISDFVAAYIETLISPNAESFITKCSVPATGHSSGYDIHVMPAGIHDEKYGERLNRINWNDLYRNKSGYLLFEDLKAQWKSKFNFDYVLIDSRTGHTDVSGICTRQLPETVVAVFYPNSQNRDGLRSVISSIRRQKDLQEGKEIDLIFTSSNTPNLDDENSILFNSLEKFKTELNYNDLCIIHHYESLDLLKEKVFVHARPNTNLAKEYRNLTDRIIELNHEDRDGSISFLNKIKQNRIKSRNITKATELENKIDKIREFHSEDGEILSLIGDISLLQGRIHESLETYENALKNGHDTSDLHRSLATIYRQLSQRENCVKSLENILNSDADYFDTSLALQWLSELNPESLSNTARSKAFNKLDFYEKYQLIDNLKTSRKVLPYVLEIINLTEENLTAEQKASLKTEKSLVLIGMHEFSEAKKLYGSRSELLEKGTISNVFNYAMADFGENLKPDKELFTRVLELQKTERHEAGANYAQCIAICYAALGDSERSNTWLDRSTDSAKMSHKSTFSAWSYLMVSPEQLIEDNNDIRRQTKHQSIVPKFAK